MTLDRQTSRNFGHRTDLRFDLENKPADRQTLKLQKILVLSPDLVTLGIFNESESRIFGPLTKSRPNYLGSRDKLRISQESSSRISGTSDQIFLVTLEVYDSYVRTQERQYQFESEQPRFNWLSELDR